MASWDSSFSLTRYYSGKRGAAIIDRVLLSLLCLFILLAPLPFGSVQYFSLTIIEITASVCFLLWILKLCFFGKEEERKRFGQLYRNHKENWKKLPFFHRHERLAKLLRMMTLGLYPRRNPAHNLVTEEVEGRFRYFSIFGYPVKNTGLEEIAVLFFLILILQMIPLPSFLAAILSPSSHLLYREAAEVTGGAFTFHPLSVDPYATLSKLLEYITYFLLYLVVVNNIGIRSLFLSILYAIFISAVFQGVYGLYEFLSGHQQIFQYKKTVGLDSASGTFINRNHYAAYLEMSLPLLIALVVGRISILRAFHGTFFARLSHALETEGSQVLLLLFMITLVATGLLFSLSRSGISFGIVSLLVFFFLYWRGRQTLSTKTYLILGIGGTIALAVWIGLDPILVRFLKISENWQSEGARWQVYTDTVRMFLHFPLTGTGAGTFDQIYPMFRSFPHKGIYLQAHNDYLQFIAETGLVTILLLMAFFDVLFSRLLHVSHQHFHRLTIIQMGAFCSLLGLGLHSITDFSFQIPAIAVQGTIVAGLFFSHYHAENQGLQR